MSTQLSKFHTILQEKMVVTKLLEMNNLPIKSMIVKINPSYYADIINSDEMREFIPEAFSDKLFGMEKIITLEEKSFKIYVELEI